MKMIELRRANDASKQGRLALGVGITCGSILGLVLPLTLIFSQSDRGIALKWFQNMPVYSIFMLSAFPLGVGILFEVGAGLIPKLATSARRLEFAGVFVTLAAMALFVTTDGIPREPLSPLMLRSERALDAAMLENRLRQDSIAPGAQKDHAAEVLRYKSIVGAGFGSVRAIVSDGSAAAWSMFTVTILASFTVPLLFTIMYALVRNPHIGETSQVDLVLLALVLFLTFLPFRAYGTWYRDHIYTHDLLNDLLKFIVLESSALAMAGALILRRRTARAQLLFGLMATLATTVAGVAGQAAWDWLTVLSRTPPAQLLALHVLFILVIGLYSFSVRSGVLDLH